MFLTHEDLFLDLEMFNQIELCLQLILVTRIQNGLLVQVATCIVESLLFTILVYQTTCTKKLSLTLLVKEMCLPLLPNQQCRNIPLNSQSRYANMLEVAVKNATLSVCDLAFI